MIHKSVPRCRWLRSRQAWLFSLPILFASIPARAQPTHADFALQDKDTVVFFGDSNTQWGSYPTDIENYSLLRFPDRHIRFVNAGADGAMASTAFFRLDKEVFGAGATVVIVMFGINDISWGNYADSTFRQTFLDYTAKIVDACRKRNVRVYVASYPITAAPVGEKARDPYGRFLGTLASTDSSLLQRLGDEAMRLAEKHGALTIDVERAMRRIAANAPPGTRFHQDDGVHLNELGQQVLAFTLLAGLGAPSAVSTVEIDARTGRTVRSEGATITGLKLGMSGLDFVRLDKALPLTFWTPTTTSGASIEKIFAPINGYFVAFKGLLPRARYDLEVDGISLLPECGLTAKRLESGLNLATLSSSRYLQRGPWAQQAIELGRITDGKADLEAALSYQRQNEVKGVDWRRTRERISAAIGAASLAQKAIARPVPYHFTLKPLSADSSAKCASRERSRS